jgi:hypothetical protein
MQPRSIRCASAAIMVIAFATVTLLSRAEVAMAWACGSAPVVVLPSGNDVPTNAVVQVRFPSERVSLSLLGPRQETLKTASVGFGDAQVRVMGPDGLVKAMQTTVLSGAVLPSLRLSFAKPLRASSTYEVVVQIDDDAYPIGGFVTGARVDNEPPRLESIKKARLFRIKNPGYKEASGPYARVRVARAKESELTAAYEIHELADGKGPSETLRAVVASQGDFVSFGRRDVCAPTDFVFADKGKLRLGIRPLDHAGNAGPMVETTINLELAETVDSGK